MPDGRHRPADRRPDLGQAGRHDARQRRRVRHHAVPDGRSEPGHRPRHRPRAGTHAAGHDHRVRRQPHRDPRRVRRAGVRHRHERGRARAGHPDPAADRARSGWRSTSTATCRRASRPRTSSSRSSARSAPGGGIGHVIEYRGPAIEALSMEGRMTVCNMSIEAGARAGLVAPDDTTFAYLEGRAHAPKGAAWEAALDDWRTLRIRRRRGVGQAGHDRRFVADAARHVGHEPRPGRCRSTTSSRRPTRSPIPRPARPSTRALEYMDLTAGHADPRHRRRHRVHRLVHEQPDRGPARRGRGLRRAARHGEAGDGRARAATP